jgi:anti-sigma regulatory factor (Ser/Thr protein kinase)
MFTLNFIDTGTKFNPLERKDPNIHESVEERDIGGLGIYMTKKFADELKYEYVGNMNILTFKKKI